MSAVIKPFKKQVESIEKRSYWRSGTIIAYLYINTRSSYHWYGESIVLPAFEASKMYKGMEDDRCYSLKELGLE